ncbi:MarC family protein [Sphingosinicella sp. BN140058]|uniref:MarC family protein n=1 Tax=Sphingosinicella sp. BN140058 TaxID=1892855 RepID=UPI001010B6CC|nr:MarC family protein [Sphingosinicella sp. BN140058]QAY75724.1 MarC family protein [Sphingosinicella sp. BN140058]
MDLLLAFLMILFALNPVGKASLFIAELHLLEPAVRRRIVLRELALALIVMASFLAAATVALERIGRAPLLVAAGGLVLAVMGARRLLYGGGGISVEAARRDRLFFPLAFPFIAGPSVLAAELVLVARDPTRWPGWGTAAYLAWIVSGVLLYASPRVQASLGPRGVRLVEIVAGVGLLLLAVEIFLYGSLEAPGFLPVG